MHRSKSSSRSPPGEKESPFFSFVVFGMCACGLLLIRIVSVGVDGVDILPAIALERAKASTLTNGLLNSSWTMSKIVVQQWHGQLSIVLALKKKLVVIVRQQQAGSVYLYCFHISSIYIYIYF
jgi:hypothetical protein